MNYNDLKKDELIQLLIEKEHLAKAVEVKDEHILKQDKDIRKLETKVKEYEHLAKAIESKDKEIQELKNSKAKTIADTKAESERIKTTLQYENEDLKKKVEQLPAIESLQELIKSLQEENIHIIKMANQYISTLRNYIKSQAGSLDTVIELEALLSEQLKNKRGEK